MFFRFLGSEDRDKFFTRAQRYLENIAYLKKKRELLRSRMVYEILSATTFGREKKGEVNKTKSLKFV